MEKRTCRLLQQQSKKNLNLFLLKKPQSEQGYTATTKERLPKQAASLLYWMFML